MDPKSVLIGLEALLTRVADTGARHLSIASAPPTEERAQAMRNATGGVPEAMDPAEEGSEAVRSHPSPAAPASARPGSAEADTVEALRLEYRDCLACKLGRTRKKLVFGVGASRPRLLFIGEGPGAEEDEQGLPFVGRAGALLTGFIRALGLTRDDVYITNVVKCRPPGNRTPEPDEIASCRPILLRQIELLDPALIVTLGNVPLKALNPDAGGITKERGRAFQFMRWRVLPTFHPSYLLRNPAGIPACWLDMRTAFRQAYPEDRRDAQRPG